MIKKINKHVCISFVLVLFLSLSSNATTAITVSSGSWYDASIWNIGRVPVTFDTVVIGAGTNVTVFGPYTDCDGLTINGFLDVGATNLTIGGRELYIDQRAIRNASCVINGGLRINGDWSHQFKVYGNVKFNSGSTFEMTAGTIMIDGCAFTEANSVTADKALLDVSDASSFVSAGGMIVMFNAHYHPTGLTIKGAKNFYNVSFGNNLTLATFAQRHTSDFLISETDKPTFSNIRLAYLPNPDRQNKVVLNDVSIPGNIELSNGLLTGSGFFKIGGNILLSSDGHIERDIECNGTWQQNIATFLSNTSASIKGNIIVNNPYVIRTTINLDVQEGTIQFMQGKFDLGDKTVSVASAPIGADDSRYVLTHSGSYDGTFVIKNVSGPTLFPVGTESAYLPVTLSAASGDFGVSAKPLSIVTDAGNIPLNSQWDISRKAGSMPADIKVQWNKSNESPDFMANRASSRIYHFNGSVWQPIGSLGTALADIPYYKLAQNVNEFSSFTVMASVTPVPVLLENFIGKLENNDARLIWQTATELNSLGFDIEKSLDGKSFSKIAFVKGSGNSASVKNYNFLDKNFTTTSYYRLKQIDLDGKFTYSSVVTLQKKENEKKLKAYPNPLINHAFLTIDLPENTLNRSELAVFDLNGRIIYQNTNLDNQESLTIPVSEWVNGLYIIRLTNGDKTELTKLFKNSF